MDGWGSGARKDLAGFDAGVTYWVTTCEAGLVPCPFRFLGFSTTLPTRRLGTSTSGQHNNDLFLIQHRLPLIDCSLCTRTTKATSPSHLASRGDLLSYFRTFGRCSTAPLKISRLLSPLVMQPLVSSMPTAAGQGSSSGLRALLCQGLVWSEHRFVRSESPLNMAGHRVVSDRRPFSQYT